MTAIIIFTGIVAAVFYGLVLALAVSWVIAKLRNNNDDYDDYGDEF